LVDILSLVALVALFAAAGLRRRLALSPVMALPLVILVAAQLLMPNRILGAAGVDHRMPLVLALVLIAATDGIARDRRRQLAIAAVFGGLFIARIAVVTDVWIAQDRALAPMVAALERLPKGSRLAVAFPPSVVNVSRRDPPVVHLASYAAIGADAFVPTLFVDPGQQPLRFTPDEAALAAATSADDLWGVFAEGRADPGGKAAAALHRYDFILFAGPANAALCGAPIFAPVAAIPLAELCAIKR
jgi:hypothetical protein